MIKGRQRERVVAVVLMHRAICVTLYPGIILLLFYITLLFIQVLDFDEFKKMVQVMRGGEGGGEGERGPAPPGELLHGPELGGGPWRGLGLRVCSWV
jgi:hypothetical protein